MQIDKVPEDYAGGVIDGNPRWKGIKASICGYSEGDAKPADVCNPQGIADAAQAFHYAQATFQLCQQVFGAYAKQLAGPNGSWKGPGAEAFLTMMAQHAKVAKQHVETISGWSGASADPRRGAHSIPTLLLKAATNLDYAQRELESIDVFYATEASKSGAGNNSNGTVTVSSRPEIVKLLDRDMGAVFDWLSGQYTDDLDKYTPPTPGKITGPSNGPGPNPYNPNGNNPNFPSGAGLGSYNGSGSGTDFGPTPWDGDTGTYNPPTFDGSSTPQSWNPGSSTLPGFQPSSFAASRPTSFSTGAGGFDPSGFGGGAAGSGVATGLGGGTSALNGLGRGPGGLGDGTGTGGAGGMFGAGMPGAGMPGAGAGKGEEERERTTWLIEDTSVWGANPDLPPDVLGRIDRGRE